MHRSGSRQIRQSLTAMMILGAITCSQFAVRAEETQSEPKHSVAHIMKEVMKKGQWKKLATGDAKQDEAESLVELLKELALNKVPHGDAKSWEEKTGAILEAAEAAAKKEPGAGERLKKAIDCRGCHQAHKE